MTENLPHSIAEINRLPFDEKCQVYRQLIPGWVYEQFQIDPETLTQNGEHVVRMRCPEGSRAMEISIRHHPHELDPALYLNMCDTFNNQLMVLLVVISDPFSERYNIDRDLEGHETFFGTRSRNLPEERRALAANLAPGQIRRGMRSFRSVVPIFEDFVARMGHNLFLIEPLSYHNAIIFERYGFAYTHGRRDMELIHEGFQPGGYFYARLDDVNPFRQVAFANSIRGRSWAIHDGILGHPFTGFQMYKRIGKHAGVDTFPGGKW